ncbi:zinc finger protein 830-like isoform X2 [Dysidea avara]|uniref:zinc finger protein 830-like isoform X2 n=1 Tax=Dysidea avara TaxID=196820 RepID=UPI0033248613
MPITMDNAKQKKLRQLMKEQKALSSSAKINSPLARYNSLGQLSCGICNVPVKSNVLWTAHVQSKKHKEMIVALKVQKETAAATVIKNNNSSSNTATELTTRKRKQDENDATVVVETKKPKADKDDEASPLAETKELEIEEASHDADKVSGDLNNPSLPADFFDNQQNNSEANKNDDTSEDQKEEPGKQRSDSSSQLPQGFFDDPKVDAKVRKVEYKDPELEEWEKFKKSMLEVNKISDSIVDEEDDEAKVDREFTELSEQSECYTKAELLRQKQELFLRKRAELKHTQVNSAVPTNPEQSSSDSDNEGELDEFLDWRSKVV